MFTSLSTIDLATSHVSPRVDSSCDATSHVSPRVVSSCDAISRVSPQDDSSCDATPHVSPQDDSSCDATSRVSPQDDSSCDATPRVLLLKIYFKTQHAASDDVGVTAPQAASGASNRETNTSLAPRAIGSAQQSQSSREGTPLSMVRLGIPSAQKRSLRVAAVCRKAPRRDPPFLPTTTRLRYPRPPPTRSRNEQRGPPRDRRRLRRGLGDSIVLIYAFTTLLVTIRIHTCAFVF